MNILWFPMPSNILISTRKSFWVTNTHIPVQQSKIYLMLQAWIKFDPSIYNWLHGQWSVTWYYIPIPKLKLCSLWRLGMNRWFDPKLDDRCIYLSMPGLRSIHVDKRGPRYWLASFSWIAIVMCWIHIQTALITHGKWRILRVCTDDTISK